MKIKAEEFQKMLHTGALIKYLILNLSTKEIIDIYQKEKELDVVLTINGFEVDLMKFLNLLEEQYNEQTAHSAKKIYGDRMDKILEPFSDAMNTLQRLWDHIEGEATEVIAEATDSKWMLDNEEEEEEGPAIEVRVALDNVDEVLFVEKEPPAKEPIKGIVRRHALDPLCVECYQAIKEGKNECPKCHQVLPPRDCPPPADVRE